MRKIKKPKCGNCWDKGYSTEMRGLSGSADFVGDKSFYIAPTIHKNYCSCAKGKRLYKQSLTSPAPFKG